MYLLTIYHNTKGTRETYTYDTYIQAIKARENVTVTKKTHSIRLYHYRNDRFVDITDKLEYPINL